MAEQYYLGNMVFDITGTLRDYDFTKRSVVNLNRVILSRQFEEMPSDTIFHYLLEQMEVVSFGDYLKRYLYENSRLTDPYTQVPEEYYFSVISDSFAMNRAPHSFAPVKSRWSNIIKRWLRSDSASRDTVFLLGFGLRMSDQDVSEFLTKVLKEQDFRLDDPRETVFWHCFHHGLPYSMALSLLDAGEAASKQDDTETASKQDTAANTDFWKSVRGTLPVYLSNPDKIKEYLAYLRHREADPGKTRYDVFKQLYDRAMGAIRQLAGKDGTISEKKLSRSGAYDMESLLCSGTPRTGAKNLIPASRSVLSRQFEKKRISRQRLGRILRRESEAERFDLITLLFLIYSLTVEPEWPTSRYILYIDEINDILGQCGMMGVYPVNPYESFVLMCLLTEDPLAAYNDVWEISYDTGKYTGEQ